MKLAMEPPLVRRPTAAGSYPTISPIQPTASRSIVVGPGADRHDVTFWFAVDARRSPSTPTKAADELT